MSGSEADLLALMRAERVVQKRWHDRQELLELDPTEETVSGARISAARA